MCIVCTNGEQKISVDNYVGEQGNVCAFGYDVIPTPLEKKITNFGYNSGNRKIGVGYTSFFKAANANMATNCVL